MDKYQKRYLKHQERKKLILSKEVVDIDDEEKKSEPKLEKAFLELINQRQSQRIFNDKKISKQQLLYIKNCLINTPSSCNRQAIQVKIIRKVKDKKQLQDLLVGGAGWISGADTIFLFFADMAAYKSPAEIDFMPYLDAGFMGMSVCYAAEALGIGSCFVNPNIRQEKKNIFDKSFNNGYRFCGACAIGNYTQRSFKVKKTIGIFLK